jgi:predicted DsbA family dithiol-disulfide isomerase
MRIDIWSDVACPWCYVGKRNLETALAELDLDEVEIRWRAFELDPTAPPSTTRSMSEILSAKYHVPLEQAVEMNQQMTAMAASVGLEYHLDAVQLGNSFDAHRLAKMAEEAGQGEEAAEALFAAYFTEGRRLSDHDVLVDIGSGLGLDTEEIASMLDSDRYAEDVRADEAMAQEAGFTGVPTYVIDGRFAIPGAQPPETLIRLLGKVAAGVTDPSQL